MKNPPMRMFILLAVFWAAGSLLLAAESPSAPKPPATANTTQSATKTDATKTDAAKTDSAKTDAAKTDAAKTDAAKTDAAKADATKTDAAKADAKDASKDGDKKSIAEQAEAALKAAYEADPKVPAKGDPDAEQHAKDDTQTAPTGKGPSPQRFVPTEQVRADFDVSFPIDI